jgi:predicted cobalt transporter CbtA
MYKKINKKYLAFVGYATFIAVVFYAMPNNPDPITAPMDLVNNFRIMSALSMTIFWASLGLIFGTLWQKFRPDNMSIQSQI